MIRRTFIGSLLALVVLSAMWAMWKNDQKPNPPRFFYSAPSTIAGQHIRKLTCPQGHPYEGSNLRIGKQYDGSSRKARFCRKCHANTERNRRERLRFAAVSR